MISQLNKIKEAKIILKELGLPLSQQNEISAFTLLALCGIGPKDQWSKATRIKLTITKGIMLFMEKQYGKVYAPNTRETVRRQVLHQFVQAHIADYNPFDPDLPTNSPNAHYAISEAALFAIKTYGTNEWTNAVNVFCHQKGQLIEIYERHRTIKMIPVEIPNGQKIDLSPGKHNQVQKAIIEEFIPRFAPGTILIYLGDTAKKVLIQDIDILNTLGIPFTEHDKLPDVMLYDKKRNWLFLIEAVTSHGPMSPKRVLELESLLKECPAGCIFVSAFPNIREFRKNIKNIAWETEIWISEIPDHMIHYNGDRFFGPRDKECLRKTH